MAKAIYLLQIRKRMESIQKEYNALSEAYQILSSAGSTRGRKAKIPTLQEMLGSEVKVKTGRRGRPPGAKNKPGAKKPGPKPSAVKTAPIKVEKVKPVGSVAERTSKPEVKPTVVKSTVKPVKAVKASKPAKAVKPAVSKPVAAKPVSKAEVKVALKKPAKGPKGKRTRIPNLAEKIQDLVAKSGRFTTNSVITDKLASLYPGKSRSDLGKYISVILANMKARKELAVVTQDAKGNKMRSGLWGLPTWFEGTKPKVDFLK
jgi:hypothetical protein